MTAVTGDTDRNHTQANSIKQKTPPGNMKASLIKLRFINYAASIASRNALAAAAGSSAP